MADAVRAERIAALPLPALFRNGERFAFDGVAHTFFGWTADGRAQLMGPTGLLQVEQTETGREVYPDKAQLLAIMASGRLVRRAPVANAVRDRARRRRLARQEVEARKTDKVAHLRMAVLKLFDREQPALGDKALETWRDGAFDEDLTRAEYGLWPAGPTIRKWVRERGRRKDRRWSDVASERGRTRSRRRHRSVVALAAWHAVECAKLPNGNVWSSFCAYEEDHRRLVSGEPLSFAPRNPLPRPPGEPECYCYERFRQMVREADLPDVAQARSGRRGRRRKYGGGGASPEVTKLFEAVQLDAQDWPAFVLVDLERGVAMGKPCVTLSIERLTKVCPGANVSGSGPNTTTLMRTIADIWRPSAVPPRLAEDFPELALIGGVFDALEMDAGSENTSRALEDLVGDAGFEMRIATPDAPMDKSDIERLQRTIQDYLAREMHSHALDVRTLRELGLDPAGKAVLPLDVFERLLREAIATYHVQHHDGIGTTPLEAFLAARLRDGHDWPADPDEFEDAAAEVEYDVRFDRTGFTLKSGLRYSCHQETPKLLAEELAAAHGLGSARKGWIKTKAKFRADDLGTALIWSDARGTYVRFPCTRPDYATGLPLWLHEEITAWAGRTGRPVITPKQQRAARTGFVELVRGLTHKIEPRLREIQFKLMSTPSVGAWLGRETADLLRAPPTVTGPSDAIGREFAAAERRDRMMERPRSRRGTQADEVTGDAALDALLTFAERDGTAARPGHARTPASPSGLEKPQRRRVRRSAADAGRRGTGGGHDDGDHPPVGAVSGERNDAPPTVRAAIDYDYD